MKTKLFLSLALCASAHCHGMELARRWKNLEPDECPVRVEMHDGFAVTANEQIILTTIEYGATLVCVVDGICCPMPGRSVVRGAILGYCTGKVMGAATVVAWRRCCPDGDRGKKRK